MKRILLALLLAPSLKAQAPGYNNTSGGTYSKNWWSHKVGHFSICFGYSWGGSKLGYPKTGFALGMAWGLAKEVHDVRRGQSMMNARRDLLIDLAGGLAGLYVTKRFGRKQGVEMPENQPESSWARDERERITYEADLAPAEER